MGSFIFRAYYYIDDVSVIKLSGDGIDPLYTYGFSIFPNPSNNAAHIGCTQKDQHEIAIMNQWGQKVYSAESFFGNSNNITIDVKDFPAGIYFIQLSGEDKVQQQPLLIER